MDRPSSIFNLWTFPTKTFNMLEICDKIEVFVQENHGESVRHRGMRAKCDISCGVSLIREQPVAWILSASERESYCQYCFVELECKLTHVIKDLFIDPWCNVVDVYNPICIGLYTSTTLHQGLKEAHLPKRIRLKSNSVWNESIFHRKSRQRNLVLIQHSSDVITCGVFWCTSKFFVTLQKAPAPEVVTAQVRWCDDFVGTPAS